jgi:hypothetical protein
MVQTQDKRHFFTLYTYSINYIRRQFRRRKSVHRKTNKVFYFRQNEHNLAKKKVQCKVYLCTLSVSVGQQWYFISECWTAMVLYQWVLDSNGTLSVSVGQQLCFICECWTAMVLYQWVLDSNGTLSVSVGQQWYFQVTAARLEFINHTEIDKCG